MTGSPIFNQVQDLNALLKFLNMNPFDSAAYFNSHITGLFKKDQAKALGNLRRLFQCVALRRTKNIVMDQLQLPPKVENVQEIHFRPEERAVYDVLRQSLSYFYHSTGPDANKNGSNGSVLQTITWLRRFCDHNVDLLPPEIGMLVKESTKEKDIANILTAQMDTCDGCNMRISSEHPSKVTFMSFQCGHSLCPQCLLQQQGSKQVYLLCFGLETTQRSVGNTNLCETFHDYRPSTKASALLENLRAERIGGADVKRYQ